MQAVFWRRGALTLAVYAAAAVVLTWPLAINLTSRLGALQGPGDPYLNLWILGWGMHAWTTDPGSVLSGRVFDANIFFPAEGTLAYADHLLLQTLDLAPIYALTGNAVLCYNLLVLGSIAFSGLAMHVLARAVTGSTPAAFVAGLAWACWPYRTAHLRHLELQALYFLPIALWCLHRVVARRRWRDAIAFGIAAGLQAFGSAFYALTTAIALLVPAVTLAIATGQWRAARLWSRLLVGTAVAVALALPGLLPYSRAPQSAGSDRAHFDAVNHPASWQSYRQVPPENLVYGRTGVLAPRAPRAGEPDRTNVEHQLFPGLVVLLLAIAGVARNVRSDARPVAVSSLALALVGMTLSFGPAPARFAVIAFLGLALLASLGVRSLTSRVDARLALVPIVLMAIEYLNVPLPLVAAPPRHTAIGQWLAHEPTPGAVLYLPIASDVGETRYMVQSLEHRRPIVNGYSGQRPAFFAAVVEGLAGFPSPAGLAMLRELDVRFVVSPTPVAGAGSTQMPLIERARFDEGVVYQVEWTPEAIAALGDPMSQPPPLPGTVPFRAGESATYAIHWDSGPVNLPAGTAHLAVLEGAPGASRWRFEARAATDTWVSRFFRARDRFTTVADDVLRPLEHTREIREDGRDLNRTYIYDRDAGNIRVGGSRDAALAPDAVILPLEPVDSRDAMTALYYVRTLALSRGSMVSVPINEAGTAFLLQVWGAEPETIDHRGRPTSAIRLEPRLMRQTERRARVTMTVWLSSDTRRVPLRAIIDAGFGRVRAELVELNDR